MPNLLRFRERGLPFRRQGARVPSGGQTRAGFRLNAGNAPQQAQDHRQQDQTRPKMPYAVPEKGHRVPNR